MKNSTKAIAIRESIAISGQAKLAFCFTTLPEQSRRFYESGMTANIQILVNEA
jgi:hypothetical protein